MRSVKLIRLKTESTHCSHFLSFSTRCNINGSTGGTGGGGDGIRLASNAKRVHPVTNMIIKTSNLFILSRLHLYQSEQIRLFHNTSLR